ncbi:hypothetical protein HU200_049639 [Digitaria exilis]|uniref:Uncharacterized protein n=1 Tax=Digitaria exilis TaxID=1010633 RepID=A0A835AZL5_9POAL|nr:hypothetical protein HU200_049639 [Digitaria exilis]
MATQHDNSSMVDQHHYNATHS